MIKKIIGTAAALGIMAIVVLTVLGSGNYTSILPENLFSATIGDECAETSRAPRTADETESIERADSLDAEDAAAEIAE